MRHLSATELIDLLDGTLPASRAAHARECERCRAEVMRLQAVVEEAQRAEPHEPAPLYWERLEARVREAVASEAAPRSWQLPNWLRTRAALAVAASVLLAVTAWFALEFRTRVGQDPGVSTEYVGTPAAGPMTSVNGDWELVVSGAESLEWDDAARAGFAIGPGATERAIEDLSDEQQAELVRLLEAEIGRLPS